LALGVALVLAVADLVGFLRDRAGDLLSPQADAEVGAEVGADFLESAALGGVRPQK
jgi:hypothetical protein